MANKILSVSIVEEKINIFKLDQGMMHTYTPVAPAQFDVDKETLVNAAQWADEIRINKDFPSAEHLWSPFPKVANRILKRLVARHATQTMEVAGGVRVAIQNQGPMISEGLNKNKVSFLAVQETGISEWEKKTFGKYYKKIHLITSLPVALAAAVIQSESPKNNFMVVWPGELSTVFVVSTPEGDVKVARNIPVGMDNQELDENDPESSERFTQDFDRDIMTTLLVYNDMFDDHVCENFYLLGNEKFQSICRQFPLQSVADNGMYQLNNLPVRGSVRADKHYYHLLGNLFTARYNLVDPSIVWEQRFDRGYKYACFVLISCIATAGVWMVYSMPEAGAEKSSFFATKKNELEVINTRLYELEQHKIKLKRFDGWKNFYKNTYTNQPAWSSMLSSLAVNIPKEFVINSFDIRPGKGKGVHGWDCNLDGHINSIQWNEGLALLRQFGSQIHRSPYYRIVDIQYNPLGDDKQAGSQVSSFNFVIKMELLPQENE